MFKYLIILLSPHSRRNRIDAVMVSIFALSAVYCGFESWLNQIRDYGIGTGCFSALHATLGSRIKSKDWLAAGIQDNWSKWYDI